MGIKKGTFRVFSFCLLLVWGNERKGLWIVGKWAVPHLEGLLSSQQRAFPVVFWFAGLYLEVISFKYFGSQINKWLNSLTWDGWEDVYVLACKPSFLPSSPSSRECLLPSLPWLSPSCSPFSLPSPHPTFFHCDCCTECLAERPKMWALDILLMKRKTKPSLKENDPGRFWSNNCRGKDCRTQRALPAAFHDCKQHHVGPLSCSSSCAVFQRWVALSEPGWVQNVLLPSLVGCYDRSI